MQKEIIKKSIVKILIGVLLVNMIPINLTFADIQISNILKVKANNSNIPIAADITWGDGYQYPDGLDGQNFVGNYNSMAANGETTALRFDLSSLVDVVITKAELRFTIVSKIGDPYVDIFKSTDDTTWSGAGADNTIPNNIGDKIIDQGTVPAETSEASYDITDYTKEEFAGDRKVTLILSGITSGDNDFGFGTMGNMDAYSTAYLYLEYSIPTPLAQVTGVSLSSSGVATWNDVANESEYSVQLYKNGSATGTAVTESADILSHDFLSDMRAAGTGTYTVKVTSKGDGLTYSDGADSNASGGQTVTKLSTVSSGLTWASDVAHWSSVSATSYDVQLYKDGSALGTSKNVLEANVASGAAFASEIASSGGGTYTYKVTAKGDNLLVLDADQSAVSNNNIKAIQLTQVTGITLSSLGIVNWTNVSNATGYILELFKNGVSQGTASYSDGVVGADFRIVMKSGGAGVYTVKVTAKGDGTYYSNATQSAASNSQTVTQLANVTGGLIWTGDVAHWTAVTSGVSYNVQLYKDGSSLGSAKNVLQASTASGADFTSEIAAGGGGSYTYKVTALGDSNFILDASQSAASNINLKATPLAQVTGEALSLMGVASWNATANATSYIVKLYKGGSYTGDSVGTAATSIDVLSYMRANGAGVYTVKITAIGDGVNYSDGTESAASSSQTITKLTTAAGLTWSSDTAHWSAVTNAVSYDVQLYKNGSAVSGALANVLEADRTTGVDFSSQISSNGGGTYTYKVTAKSNSVLLLDADQSTDSTDNIKSIQLAQVTNVALSALGVASWDDVSHEASYSVQLYKDGSALGSAVVKSADVLSHDFLSAMRIGGEGTYTVKVTAIGDGTYYTDGIQSISLSSQTVLKLTTATSLTWTGNIAHFSSVATASSYEVQLYKGGSAVAGAVKTINVAGLAAGADFATEIASEGAGTYTFTVKAKGDGILILDGEESLPSLTNIVATPLAQVTGVALSSTGIASWNNVANETNYSVQLFKNGSAIGSAVLKNADVLSYDFLSTMRSAGAGTYSVKVTAIGDSINYSDGLQSTASAGQIIEKLATVIGLTWDGNIAKFTIVPDAVNYLVQLYKNGNALGSSKSITSADASLGAAFGSEIAAGGFGIYTFKVTAKGNTNLILDAESSSASTENIKSTQLAQVTGVTLSDTGVATWADVDNETNYSIQLYKGGVAYSAPILKNANVLSHDYLSEMRAAGAGVYTVQVIAKGDGVLYLDAAASLSSPSQSITKLATVTEGLSWSNTLAKWTPVTSAVSYDVQLYKNGNASGTPVTALASNADSGVEFNSAILLNGLGTYTYKVTAKGNTTLILGAEQSTFSNDYIKKTEQSKATFDKNDDSKNNKKISVELSLDASLLTSIKNGKNTLKAKGDYKVSSNVVTISKDYLETLGVGSSTLTILYNNGDKQTIIIKVVDTTKDTAEDTTSDSTSTTVTNATQNGTNKTTTVKANVENSTGNASHENSSEVENGATDSENTQQETDESTNQGDSGAFEVETETTENTPTFTLPSEDELYDAVLTEEDRAAIAAGEKVVIKVVVKAVEEPEDGDIVRENLGVNTFGMFLDISILKTIGTQQSEVHDLNQPITINFDIPEELKGLGKYAIIRVHNGESIILEDEDDNPDTITFSTDRFSTYALVYEEVDATTASVVPSVADKKINFVIILFTVLALISVGTVVVILKKKRKEVK